MPVCRTTWVEHLGTYELPKQRLNPLKPLLSSVRLLLHEVARDGRRQRPNQPNTDQHQQDGYALPKRGGRIPVAVSDSGHRLDGPPQALPKIVNIGSLGAALGEGDQSAHAKTIVAAARTTKWKPLCVKIDLPRRNASPTTTATRVKRRSRTSRPILSGRNNGTAYDEQVQQVRLDEVAPSLGRVKT